jgi:hypothetical protein
VAILNDHLVPNGVRFLRTLAPMREARRNTPMGFTVYYRSARPVRAAEADAIRRAARRANAGRTWLGCEPVHFFEGAEDGHLLGGSKPNFLPHPDDAAAAGREGLPDGTTRDLLDILCQLSREYGVDWALSHDYEPALGFIRGGVCDDAAREQIDALADLGDVLGELELGEED